MLDVSLAVRYANALFTTAQDQDCLEVVLKEIGGFIDVLSGDRQVQKFFFHPAIAPMEKKRLLDDIVEKQWSPVSRKFLSVLLDAKRINYLNLIHETVVELFNRHQNKVRASISSVFPLEAAIQRKVRESIERYLQKKVELDFRTDADLLGGVKLTVEDKVIDGSVLYNLKRLENKIAIG